MQVELTVAQIGLHEPCSIALLTVVVDAGELTATAPLERHLLSISIGE